MFALKWSMFQGVAYCLHNVGVKDKPEDNVDKYMVDHNNIDNAIPKHEEKPHYKWSDTKNF